LLLDDKPGGRAHTACLHPEELAPVSHMNALIEQLAGVSAAGAEQRELVERLQREIAAARAGLKVVHPPGFLSRDTTHVLNVTRVLYRSEHVNNREGRYARAFQWLNVTTRKNVSVASKKY
jgi:hypothetical protein